MTKTTQSESCVRCGAFDNVKAVNYVRAEQQFTEPWCEPCRRSKLVKAGSHEPGRFRTALVIVAVTVLGAVLMWVLALLTS